VDWSETRYAKSGELHIAYQVLGEGGLDLLILPYGLNVSIDAHDEEPHWNRFERRLGSFARAIRFDPRGLGLSDPFESAAALTIEQWTQDAIAVLDAVGSERAALFATAGGGLVALMLCASHPERTTAQVLTHCFARTTRAPDYPFGIPQHVIDSFFDAVLDSSGADGGQDVALVAPSLAHDPEFRAWWSRAARRGASPASARAIQSTFTGSDVRDLLPLVKTPTLLLHRTGNRFVRVDHARYLAEHIADARLVELPGADHVPFVGDAEALLAEVEQFLTGTTGGPTGERVLATVLFSDIVGSTSQAAAMGDRRWRDLLDDHDRAVARQVQRFQGTRVKATGDGVLATFDGPTQAIRCGVAMRDSARQLGLEIRVGVHSGEIERRGDDIGGIAVNIASRVQAEAEPGTVLVSRVVTDLVAGSGLSFSATGDHELKGVPGTWQLYTAEL
jgi:class 3 adenylate cyclase